MQSENQLPPVDLQFLSDRARAYVVGLEAKLKEIRTDNERLRSADYRDQKTEAALKKAYRSGWKECANHFRSEVQSLRGALSRVNDAAFQAYLQTPEEEFDVEEEPNALF